MHINHLIKTPSHLCQSSRFESMCPFCHLLPSYTMHQEFGLFCCIRWWGSFYSSSSGQPFSLYWFFLLLGGHCKSWRPLSETWKRFLYVFCPLYPGHWDQVLWHRGLYRLFLIKILGPIFTPKLVLTRYISEHPNTCSFRVCRLNMYNCVTACHTYFPVVKMEKYFGNVKL